MLPEFKPQASKGINRGLTMQVAGLLLPAFIPATVGLYIGGALFLAGVGVMTWGCLAYAQGKCYPAVYGLLGLLSFLGMLILVLLPDKDPWESR